MQDNLLPSAAQLLLRDFLGVVGDLVVGANLAAHIEGLGEQNSACHCVARVRVEGIHHALSHAIDRSRHTWHQLSRLLHERCQFGVLLHDLRHGLREVARHIGAEVGERRLLIIAQQGDFLARQHIASGQRHLGQIVGASSLAVVGGFIYLRLLDGQLLVLFQGQISAFVQRIGVLRKHAQRQAQQHKGKKDFFHGVIFS